MVRHALARFATRRTPQSQPIPASTQVPNSAGGYAWQLDDWARLRRFLVLGVDGGSYYAAESALVADNAQVVLRCVEADGRRTVDEIVVVSEGGRNPKQQPVIFALAACCAADDPDVRTYALSMLRRVCRTGTQLFLFAGFVEQFRGWGRSLRRAVAAWYEDREPDALAYQLVKYQQREGWSHRDLLRLAKPRPPRGGATDAALRWAVGKADGSWAEATPALIRAHAAVMRSTSAAETAALVRQHRLPWEALTSEHLRDPEVWAALLPQLGIGALVRNLGRMTSNGTLAPGGAATELVLRRLADEDGLLRARLHPIQVLSALVTYERGAGARGRLRWEPVREVIDALDAAFYATFGNVEEAGKRTLIALDVSGSMTMGEVAGVPGLTPRVASAAMAALTIATEPSVQTVAFTTAGRGAWQRLGGGQAKSSGPASWLSGLAYGVTPLALSPRQRLDDIVRRVDGLPFGGTDCALPMLYALDRSKAVDTFVVYTDSETWAGDIHPAQALRQYRERSGIAARLIVVGMVSNGFTIADPDDAGMLDVVGFDTAAPQVIADFSAGRLGG